MSPWIHSITLCVLIKPFVVRASEVQEFKPKLHVRSEEQTVLFPA